MLPQREQPLLDAAPFFRKAWREGKDRVTKDGRTFTLHQVDLPARFQRSTPSSEKGKLPTKLEYETRIESWLVINDVDSHAMAQIELKPEQNSRV